jgi:hypothetical protein
MIRFMEKHAGLGITKSKSTWMIWLIPSGKTTRLLSTAMLTPLVFLAGCSSGGSIAIGSLTNTVRGAFHGLGTPPITRADVRAVSYASLGYQVGDSAEQMVVLAGNDGDDLVWTSSAKITLVTQNGRIVRTIGLQHDLRSSTRVAGDATGVQPGAASIWRIVFEDPDLAVGVLQCRIETSTPEDISILQRSLATTRLDEICQSADLRWRFQNRYWVDPANGTVWRSIQHVDPRLKQVTLEILRPYVPGPENATQPKKPPD